MILVTTFVVLMMTSANALHSPPSYIHSRPPMGWSTWTTFKCNVNESLIKESADTMIRDGFLDAGYNYILIDDCWALPERENGTLHVDSTRFPSGFESLTQYVHDKGMKIGIYTSVGSKTCAGFAGSLNHEAQDAKQFYDWGFDFVKHDTCVQSDNCSVHNGCIQEATRRMRDALYEVSSGEIFYYLDSGNPTNEMKVYNPKGHHLDDGVTPKCVAQNAEELSWRWATSLGNVSGRGPHMIKSMWDIKDTYESMMLNVHSLIRTAPYQECAQWLNPDMLTIGMGGQTLGMYRTQFYYWVVLGSPLLLSNDVRNMKEASKNLVLNNEAIAINRDRDCVMGSLVQAVVGETWIRPLSDGSFAVLLVNQDEHSERNITVKISKDAGQWGDFHPIIFGNDTQMKVRDIGNRKDVGVFNYTFTADVAPRDALLFRFQVL